MAGNAWEWTADWWESSTGVLPVGLSRAVRGGSYLSSEKALTPSKRAALLATLSLPDLGFRCVKDEPNLPAISGTGVPPVAAVAYEGSLKFKGEAAELKCSPKFDEVTCKTALGPLVVKRPYILALSPTEVRLLGGSVLKGELGQSTLLVQWSLGDRQINVADLETYRRTAPPLLVSVGVTPDGANIPPASNVTVTLADGSVLTGTWTAPELRLNAPGMGEIALKPDQAVGVDVAEGKATIALKDGNTVTGELVGDYPIRFLEGELTLRGAAALRSIAFTASGLASTPAGEMVWVAPGEFLMGAGEGDTQASGDEKPAHRVRITKGFWIGKYEVTNEQYARFLTANGGTKNKAGQDLIYLSDSGCGVEAAGNEFRAKEGRANHPVVCVTWFGAQAYCEKYGLKLPTEAQWEYAARGPEARKYPWGNDWDASKCCNNSNKGTGNPPTMEVGSLPEGDSWCGASDMAGNVWEWCADWYDAGYYAKSPASDPTGPTSGQYRLLRGGSWLDGPCGCRSAFRSYDSPVFRTLGDGFRVARTP